MDGGTEAAILVVRLRSGCFVLPSLKINSDQYAALHNGFTSAVAIVQSKFHAMQNGLWQD